MTENKQTKLEEIKRHPQVMRELRRAGQRPKQKIAKAGDKLLIGTHAVLLVVLGAFYYLIDLRFFAFAANYAPLIRKLTLAAMSIVLLLAILKLVEVYFIRRVENSASRYTLTRIFRLVTWILIALAGVSIIFQNWYTAIVSFGLISLILGFALQTPITSFIGWIYILVREPYRIGDRIKIGEATGDVIDISYFDTTLWEFGGEYLSTDHPSGRVIKFPNSNVLSTPVYNYSWPLFPYLWNEVKFNVAYNSDLEFIARTMQEVAEKEVGQEMVKQVSVFRELLKQTPVDQLEVQEHPVVMFRVADNTWIEAIVRYLVEPREAGRVKSRLVKQLLETLNKEQQRVLFPKNDLR